MDCRICGTVHPHARGEQRTPPKAYEGSSGSSPRTWGTDQECAQRHAGRRFIPTHVGNSHRRDRGTNGSTVHPHARGEQAGGVFRRLRAVRFIPTHVGNSAAEVHAAAAIAVHPHARGEQELADKLRQQADGSSPRTWGTGARSDCRCAASRFIPTHVGNRCSVGLADGLPSVHPHARGEQVSVDAGIDHIFGSSPRTWGTAVAWGQPRDQLRFIPTHVGNRAAAGPRRRVRSVHPHARGEQVSWGERSSFVVRFIPTHVGNRSSATVAPGWKAVHPHARGEQDAPTPMLS